MMSLEKVIVYGAGKSGISATKLLLKKNAYVYLFDSNEKITQDDLQEKIGANEGFELIRDITDDGLLKSIDLCVLSPGVPTDLAEVNHMRELNIPIWGEIELAYQFGKGRVIGITGTNGKTTTTSLVGEIMKTYYKEVFVVGNIGNPYADIVDELTDDSVVVAELSSFQLETIDTFRPVVSAILNITPDHLNRHHTMECYIECKENVTKNQTMDDTCVLNYEDEVLRKDAENLGTKIIFFSSKRTLQDGMFLRDEDIFYAKDGEETLICNINELKIFGEHSYENVMAGIAMGIAMDVPFDCIIKAVTNFQAVEHRIEYVDTIHGVQYYNDSKGTNPDAAIKAVKAMRTPTLVIGGGYDKGVAFDEWIQSFDGKVRYLVLLGQTREMIAETAKRNGFTNIILVDTLEDAVKICAKKANPGDSVLLSPACASWGMFHDYEERGRLFKQYVKELPE